MSLMHVRHARKNLQLYKTILYNSFYYTISFFPHKNNVYFSYLIISTFTGFVARSSGFHNETDRNLVSVAVLHKLEVTCFFFLKNTQLPKWCFANKAGFSPFATVLTNHSFLFGKIVFIWSPCQSMWIKCEKRACVWVQ